MQKKNDRRTTWAGLVGAIAQGLKTVWPELSPIFDGATALAIGLLGYFANKA